MRCLRFGLAGQVQPDKGVNNLGLAGQVQPDKGVDNWSLIGVD